MNEDTISCLILQELKLIREEMKEEIRKLCESIQFFHYDKTNENAFNSNQVFHENLENKEQFANNLTNHNNDVIVKDEHVPELTESLTKCESNFCAEECEMLSSGNLKSDNFEVGSELSEVELDARNENNLFVKELIEQENILCETTQHEILPGQPVIVEVKSLCESKNRSDDLNFDVKSSIFERNEEVRKPSINDNSKLNYLTCKENDSEVLLKPIDSIRIYENDITHHIPIENINFSCRQIICLQSISNSSEYHRHIKTYTNHETHSGNETVQRNRSASILSNTKENSLLNVNYSDKRKKNVCNFCNKTFSTDYKHKVHMRIHDRENLHKCDICNKGFSERSHLIFHIGTHTDDRPHKCNVCKKGFQQKSQLVQHARIHTVERPHTCNVCKKGFMQKNHLVQHARIHTGERPHKCSICKKGFIQKSQLVQHARIHTGERPHKCNICKKGFMQKNHLVQHARIHTGEKPFKCYICNKNFRQNSTLLEHIRIHTGEKPYKCIICDKRFNNPSNLTSHIRIHTGDKPYKCNICNKSFSRNSGLINHARIHTSQAA